VPLSRRNCSEKSGVEVREELVPLSSVKEIPVTVTRNSAYMSCTVSMGTTFNGPLEVSQ